MDAKRPLLNGVNGTCLQNLQLLRLCCAGAPDSPAALQDQGLLRRPLPPTSRRTLPLASREHSMRLTQHRHGNQSGA